MKPMYFFPILLFSGLTAGCIYAGGYPAIGLGVFTGFQVLYFIADGICDAIKSRS